METRNNKEYLDFLTYVLIHAAAADNEIGPAEEKMIKDKATTSEYNEVLAAYKTHDTAQRTEYLENMRDKWLKTDEGKTGMIQKVQEITGVDLVLNKDEKAVYTELKRILLK